MYERAPCEHHRDESGQRKPLVECEGSECDGEPDEERNHGDQASSGGDPVQPADFARQARILLVQALLDLLKDLLFPLVKWHVSPS